MASNLTTFFPATGGSSDITDPKLLPRIANGPISSTRWIKTETGQLRSDGETGFWTLFADTALAESYSMITLSATFDTYETVLDISSSTNGGYLNYILGTYINAGNTETYKITVDGVATEIVRSVPTGSNYQASILGWVAPGKAPTSSTASWSTGAMGEQSAQTASYIDYVSGSSYNNISNGFLYVQTTAFTLPNLPWAYPNLKFKETLKVEIKRSGRYDSSTLYNNAAVRHTII